MLIDTHCHLDFKDFDKDRDEAIERAKRSGIARIINVASSIGGTRRSIELAAMYDIVYATVGIHPHEAASVTDAAMDELKSIISNTKVVAIGEVGLDYYRNISPRDAQTRAFRRFISLALSTGLPIIIHTRNADSEALDILEEESKGRLRGVVHCFSGDMDFLKRVLSLGLFVSFTANITYKNADKLREVAKHVPVERLLLETDAPFLAAQEFRGKRNEPSYLKYLVEEWTRLSGLSGDDIERITTHNANGLFKLNIGESSKIVYPIRDSLYLNITNRCTNACTFCVRNFTSFVKGHNLKLDSEPSAAEILKAVGDPVRYKEIVFCGYGEPTMRIDVVKEVSKKLKEGHAKIRLVTNGHGDLINRRPIARELSGVIDSVSVSLDVDREDEYFRVCVPQFGHGTYGAILDFIKDCVSNNIKTEITCLDLAGVDMKRCADIARSLGADFRKRSCGIVG